MHFRFLIALRVTVRECHWLRMLTGLQYTSLLFFRGCKKRSRRSVCRFKQPVFGTVDEISLHKILKRSRMTPWMISDGTYEKCLLIGGVNEGQLSASRKEIISGKHSWWLEKVGDRSSSLSISNELFRSRPAGIE